MASYDEALQKMYSDRLTRFYRNYDEAKVASVPTLLQKYKGKEEQLLAAMVKKYGPEPEPEDGITLALVDDTLVLRCGLDCTAESLWSFVARGDGGGNEAGAAADRQHKLASRALESVEATRQALALGTLRCAEGVGWEAQLRACERLRGRATRLRPVLAGLRLELVDASTQAQAQHADDDGDDDKEGQGLEYVVADAELGVLRVDVEARLV